MNRGVILQEPLCVRASSRPWELRVLPPRAGLVPKQLTHRLGLWMKHEQVHIPHLGTREDAFAAQ